MYGRGDLVPSSCYCAPKSPPSPWPALRMLVGPRIVRTYSSCSIVGFEFDSRIHTSGRDCARRSTGNWTLYPHPISHFTHMKARSAGHGHCAYAAGLAGAWQGLCELLTRVWSAKWNTRVCDHASPFTAGLPDRLDGILAYQSLPSPSFAMLSSFGFDSKAASRNLNSLSSSRFMPSVPRGFSVHVFKNAAMPAHPPQPPMPPVAVAPPKFETIPARPSTGGQWNRQPAYHPSHNDATETQTRKQPPVAAPAPPPSSQEHRLVHIPAANRDHTVNHARPLEKYSKSSKSYGIYPSLTSDIYIYERSISSVSLDDDLASSPYSDDSSNSSDSDLLYSNTATNALAHLDTSSTRASSSTETLESTLTPRLLPNAPSSRQPPPPLTRPAPPRPPSALPAQENSAPPSARSAVPHSFTRAPEGHLQRTISISHAAAVPPIQLASAPLDVASDSDSKTVISDTHANDMVVDMLGAQWLPLQAYSSSAYTTPPRSRRDSDARVPSSMHRREPSAQLPVPVSRDPRDVPVSRPTQYQRRTDSDEVVHPRAPPGLVGNATVVATAADGSGGRGMRDVQNASSSSANNISPASRSLTSAPPLARTPTSRPPPPQPSGPQARHADMGSSLHIPPPSYPPAPSATANAYSSSSPPRRDARAPSPQHSPTNSSPTNVSFTSGAAAQNMNASSQSSPITTTSVNANTNAISNAVGGAGAGALVVAAAAAKRSVRWTENLVCPSPVPVENRRKGWFNRRGEQLWTNDGQFKLPEPGQEYPPDLAYYPEPNSGWMNEEGVRIDMQHRLIPKQPLRPALKRSKPLNVNGAQ